MAPNISDVEVDQSQIKCNEEVSKIVILNQFFTKKLKISDPDPEFSI